MTRRLLLTALLLLASRSPAAAEIMLRMSQNVPGDSKAIVVTADEISTWMEGTQRILLLKGLVLVEHGVVHARMQQAVGWVDLDRKKKTGILRLELYGEGDVTLENSPDSKTGPNALIDLNTRGELKIQAQRGKVIQKALANDPFYRKALAERTALLASQAKRQPPIQRTSFQPPMGPDQSGTPTPAPSPGGPPATGAPNAPAPMPNPPNNPVTPPGQGPPPAGVVPGQTYPPPSTSMPPGGWVPPTAPSSPPGAEAPEVPPTLPPPTLPQSAAPAAPAAVAPSTPAPQRQIHIVPRSGAWNETSVPMANGEMAYVITGGVIITISNPTDRIAILDMEADRLLIWTKGNLQEMFQNMRREEGATTREVEFYLAGNVEIRSKSKREEHTLRADEVYYDVGRNVAVAYQADLEFKQPRMPDPVHMRADELLQLSPTLFKSARAEVFSSRLPSDPGLKVTVVNGTLEQKQVPKRPFLFGPAPIDPKTGLPETEAERLFWGWHVFMKVEDIPVLYFPYVQGDPNDPLGPLQSVNISYNMMYGTQVFTTWNVYDLLGVTPTPGTRWNLNADYMSKRGPALGSQFDYSGDSLFGIPGKYGGYMKAYGLYDRGGDLLGGDQSTFQPSHPWWRGRYFWSHNEEFPADFFLQTRVSVLSDKYYLEEFYYNEWTAFPNQETFLYLKQQRDNWAWSVIAEPRIRNWVNETQRLPELNGFLLGQSFFDLLTYNAHASAGYDRLMTTHVPPPPAGLTTFGDNTGRFDLWQDLSLPFYLGPVKMVPYGVLDLAEYTKDLAGESRGRFYVGGGLRSSMPLSRVYPDIQSELLNLNGINHKIVFSTNYYIAHSDTPFTTFPELDRWNDDATDQAIRDINPIQPAINPAHGAFLATSPLFNWQTYAIRRFQDQLWTRTDTLNTVEDLEIDVRQRWQTKRGYPGMQHITDWMTLDLSAMYFPHPGRDDFNEPWSLFTYDWTWNVGDRTALVANGWVDPMNQGAHVYTVGAYLNRPDRTNFYLGYRQLDPVGSRLLTGAASYIFSPKYAMTVSSSYDLAFNSGLSNALIFTRMGSDLQVSLGVTYNSILNNFGVVFEILPNIATQTGKHAAMGPGLIGR